MKIINTFNANSNKTPPLHYHNINQPYRPFVVVSNDNDYYIGFLDINTSEIYLEKTTNKSDYLNMFYYRKVDSQAEYDSMYSFLTSSGLLFYDK